MRAERHMRGLACQERARGLATQFRLARCTVPRDAGPRHHRADLHTRPARLRASKIMAKAKQPQTPSADVSARMTTAEATVAALITHGVDTIYALPGVHNDSFFDALFKAADR